MSDLDPFTFRTAIIFPISQTVLNHPDPKRQCVYQGWSTRALEFDSGPEIVKVGFNMKSMAMQACYIKLD